MSKKYVHSAVSHAVGEDSVTVVGEAVAVSIGSLYQTIGDSVTKAAINNVYAQQQLNMTSQAASTVGVSNLLTLPV